MLKADALTADDVMAVVMLVDEAQDVLAGIAAVIAAYDAALEWADYPLRFEEDWPDDLSATALLVERHRLQHLRSALYRRYARRLDMSLRVAQLAARRSFSETIGQFRKRGKR